MTRIQYTGVVDLPPRERGNKLSEHRQIVVAARIACCVGIGLGAGLIPNTRFLKESDRSGSLVFANGLRFSCKIEGCSTI